MDRDGVVVTAPFEAHHETRDSSERFHRSALAFASAVIPAFAGMTGKKQQQPLTPG
jgi:hypothetical protein